MCLLRHISFNIFSLLLLPLHFSLYYMLLLFFIIFYFFLFFFPTYLIIMFYSFFPPTLLASFFFLCFIIFSLVIFYFFFYFFHLCRFVSHICEFSHQSLEINRCTFKLSQWEGDRTHYLGACSETKSEAPKPQQTFFFNTLRHINCFGIAMSLYDFHILF